MGRFVLVTGLPASGKSSVARAIAHRLCLPLFDKDVVLEELFEERGVGNTQWRDALSREADEVFRRRVQGAGDAGAVLTSWWKHPLSEVPSGTPHEWLFSLPGTIVEVYCRCSAATAAKRFLERARHPGHVDERWGQAELVRVFEVQASLGPLGLPSLIELDTERELDVASLFGQLENAFRSALG